MFKRVYSLFLIMLLSLHAQAQPKVTASIKPLQLIASALTETRLLLKNSQDAHHHALRPSERADLAQSEIFIWIGPQLEAYLDKAVNEMPAAKVLTVSELDGLAWLAMNGGQDPHLWLDTGNARLIAEALNVKLQALDPANDALYGRRLESFKAGLDRLDEEIRQAVQALHEKEFAVYHNAYQYFEARYGLSHFLSFTENEEISPGIRSILAIRRRLEERGETCLLLEPGVNRQELSNLLDSSTIRFVEADPLGRRQEPGPQGYSLLIRHISSALLNCLQA